MKLALITGSSGHVGSNLIRKLSKLDYKIRCIDFDGDHSAYEGFDVETYQRRHYEQRISWSNL